MLWPNYGFPVNSYEFAVEFLPDEAEDSDANARIKYVLEPAGPWAPVSGSASDAVYRSLLCWFYNELVEALGFETMFNGI